MIATSPGSSLRAVSLLVLTAAALGCGGADDDASDGPDDGGSSGGSPRDSGGPMRSGACELGCEDTVNANCAMGPKTQLECETDCERLRGGECGAEYRAYMTCGDGERVSCDAMGSPVIAACPDQRDDFVACLN